MPNKKKPIYSTREDDPQLSDEIDAFVVSLAECVDRLQDAHMERELPRLAELATELLEKASAFGYPALVDTSKVVIETCSNGKPDDAESALLELTEISQRIRGGHRGAA